jgi:ATP-binding cassette subfamily C (CFTR/MRP) protein 1
MVSSTSLSPYETAGVVSRLFFFFISPVLNLGWKSTLTINDAYPLPSHSQALNLLHGLHEAPLSDNLSAQMTQLKLYFLRKHRRAIILTGILGFLRVCLQTVQPYILFEFLRFLSDSSRSGSRPLWHGIGLVLAFFINGILFACCAANFNYLCTFNGIKVAGELHILIQQRFLTARVFGARAATTGAISGVMSSDVDSLMALFSTLHEAWLSILQLCVVLAQLAVLMNVSVVGAAVVGILSGYCLPVLQSKIRTILQLTKKRTDERISILSECLNGIRAMKIFGWEAKSLRNITVARLREFQLLKSLVQNRSIYNLVVSSIVPVISLVVFVIYSQLNTFRVDTAFACLSLMNQLTLTSSPFH